MFIPLKIGIQHFLHEDPVLFCIVAQLSIVTTSQDESTHEDDKPGVWRLRVRLGQLPQHEPADLHDDSAHGRRRRLPPLEAGMAADHQPRLRTLLPRVGGAQALSEDEDPGRVELQHSPRYDLSVLHRCQYYCVQAGKPAFSLNPSFQLFERNVPFFYCCNFRNQSKFTIKTHIIKATLI